MWIVEGEMDKEDDNEDDDEDEDDDENGDTDNEDDNNGIIKKDINNYKPWPKHDVALRFICDLCRPWIAKRHMMKMIKTKSKMKNPKSTKPRTPNAHKQ